MRFNIKSDLIAGSTRRAKYAAQKAQTLSISRQQKAIARHSINYIRLVPVIAAQKEITFSIVLDQNNAKNNL